MSRRLFRAISAALLLAFVASIVATGRVTFTAKASGNTTIVAVVPCDESGSPKNIFEPGNMSYFKISLDYSGSDIESVLLSANVYDSSGTALGIAWSNVSISTGTSSFILSLAIPKSAQGGNAVVYADAYTDWPKNMGLPLCPEVSAGFQIDPKVLLGDVTGPIQNVPDGKVNIMDVVAILAKFGTTPASPNWNPNMDLNKDGVVNMRDLAICLKNFTP
jgi:Dockerin type I domain